MNPRRATRGLALIALGLLALGIVSQAAHGDDITLSWTNPTQTETCTNAGPLTNPAGTRIWMLVADIPDPEQNITSYVIEDQLPGTYDFVATTYDTDGSESRVSGKATKEVTSFIAPSGSTVYQAVTIASGFWFVPMGTVAADTDCDVNTVANGRYRIPIDSVTWNPGVDARPVVVFANCQ